ncbi:MAG TPA: CpaF family protein [Anaerolineales bacterium]|jgi:pilus assembly protein CpaF
MKDRREHSSQDDRQPGAVEAWLHRTIIDQLEGALEPGDLAAVPDKPALAAHAHRILARRNLLLTESELEDLVRTVVDRIDGLGPLQPLLDDPSITEIMVNDPDHVFIERDGVLVHTDVHLADDQHLLHIIDRIVGPIGRRIDEASPLVDARLPDGSRVNAIIPPLAVGGPALTIRKFGGDPFTLERLVSLGTVSQQMARFLDRCVRQRLSVIISGGTGSGKTTTLNALSLCIPAGERLISIEDSAELQLRHSHWISLESRPPNLEGEGEVSIRRLVRNALRMRPDRIIVGEVRGEEAFDMLQAMNTGHRGSLTTLHANSPSDALTRLESMVLMAGFEIPVSAIRRMIGGAVDLIVQQDRRADGRRVLTSITRLRKRTPESLELVPLFRFDPKQGVHQDLMGGLG